MKDKSPQKLDNHYGESFRKVYKYFVYLEWTGTFYCASAFENEKLVRKIGVAIAHSWK